MKSSLILVTHNNFDLLMKALKSIYDNTTFPYHLIIIDNNSTDKTLGLYGANLPNTTIVRNCMNRWWCGGINQGIKLSDDCEYVFFLNDDIEVSKNWDINHINALKDPLVGAVGPLNSNKRDWQGIDNVKTSFDLEFLNGLDSIDRDDVSTINGHLTDYDAHPISISGMLAFFCTAFRRDTIEKVGFLDERYTMGGDDDQYARRLEKNGYKLQLLLNTYVIHRGGSSLKKMDPMVLKKLKERNLNLLKNDFPDYYGQGKQTEL